LAITNFMISSTNASVTLTRRSKSS